ncbi:MFS transporter [Labedaea rhizosphaerae]|uniref:Putative MFS family arabinose efflux permease n=1 Tax=Labedaea rhizosphaerae TaxID=598644 RepID=A0A4R6RYI2_LABRH|nr:MFS transporter [Labedaea rhizosphaerae]TDP92202.1 putative MFS family arabinose efflux permease [Labedaea rhizosphaerae]
MLVRLWPLALATFAVGTDGFVIAGLLPGIAADLGVSVAAAGQLVTVFALCFALSAPVTGALTSGFDRRTALVLALSVFTAGNVITAISADYPVVLAARAVTALGAGMINSAASSTAAALAPAERRGRALALVMGGLSVASVLGLPLGTLIGASDWRVTLWAVAGLGATAALGVRLRLPSVTLPATTLADRLAPMGNRTVLGIVATSMVTMAAFYTLFTYATVALTGATGGSTSRLILLLLVSGTGTVAGTLLAGRLTDRYRPRAVLVGALMVVCAGLLVAPLAVRSMPSALPWALVWGLSAGIPVVPQQHRLLTTAPSAATVVLGLNSSAIYVGIGLGGALGGLVQHWLPADLLGLPAAVVAAVALALGLAVRDRAPDPRGATPETVRPGRL